MSESADPEAHTPKASNVSAKTKLRDIPTNLTEMEMLGIFGGDDELYVGYIDPSSDAEPSNGQGEEEEDI